jgi:cytochrome b pre-mRNA-processing protein 3
MYLGVTPACRLSIAAGVWARGVAALFGLKGLRRSKRQERAGFELYSAAVTAARDPWFYQALGVPDTLDGRFDLVALHAFLLIDRLQSAPAPGPDLAQAVFDAMFSDMDNNLRELGVSDLSVGKRMRAMWEAFHGRSKVYAAAIQAADQAGLAAALARNVWRGSAPDAADTALAAYALAQAKHLGSQEMTLLASGAVRFAPAGEPPR